MDVLLLHPPAVKPGEPPLGLAVLLGYLRSRGLRAQAVDANLDAYLYLLDAERLRQAAGSQPSTALYRAIRHAPQALDWLRSPAAARDFSRYQTAVQHLNRALKVYAGERGEERLTLGDYSHGGVSEFMPDDLERVARGETATLFNDYFQQRLLPQILHWAPKLVAVSVNYRHQLLPAFALAGLLKRHCPDLTMVAGGGMLSSWRSVLQQLKLRFSVFSHLVFGPGEASLAALAEGTDGVDYFLEDASRVCFEPDFSFCSPAAYLSPQPILPVSASRGCYWRRCLFCPEAASPTHPYIAGGSASFVHMLRTLAERFRVRHFHLTDNAVPYETLRELASRRQDMAGLGWHGFVRFERDLLDPAFVRALSASGCRMLQLGLESGSQRVLDRLQKGTRLQEVATMLDNLRGAGIATYVYIMLGTPGESRDDAELTRQFLERYADRISFLNLAIMNLPRESRLLADPSAAGIDVSAPLNEEAHPALLHLKPCLSVFPLRAFVLWSRGVRKKPLSPRDRAPG
ncbi:MAG: radical SAM protein [Desulfuromonadaceae bacterium]